MTVVSPTAKAQFIDAAGVPLAGGFLYTYAAGTTTPQATYTDSTGATANSNPIVLDSRGEANIWLGSSTYKFKLTDADGTEIWTVDNISAPTSGLSPVLSGNVTIDTSSSGTALTITQSGTGAVIKVPDAVNPAVTLFTVDNTGQVGIGTASPGSALDIAGGTLQISSAGGTSYATLSANASNSTLSSVGARGLILAANSTNLVYGTSSGYVGIKNASPTVELDITGALKTSGVITGGTSITSGTTIASGTTLTAGSSLTVTTSASIGTTLSVDTIAEKTASAGVSVSNTLKVDTIAEKTASAGVTVGGVLCKNSLIGGVYRPITSETAKATTSGTSSEFTSIPSWVKRITVMLNAVSLSGTEDLLLQIGSSSGYSTSGYNGAASSLTDGLASVNSFAYSTGFLIAKSGNSAFTFNGIVVLTLVTTGIWAQSGSLGFTTSISVTTGAGIKDLSATLDRVRIITSGTNTLDAGSFNILYE